MRVTVNITANQGYGIFLEANRTIEAVVDANYNYWGNDAGYAIELITEGGDRDDIWGEDLSLNATYILDSNGEVFKYSKPLDIPTEIVAVIATLFLVGLVAIGYRAKQRRDWF